MPLGTRLAQRTRGRLTPRRPGAPPAIHACEARPQERPWAAVFCLRLSQRNTRAERWRATAGDWDHYLAGGVRTGLSAFAPGGAAVSAENVELVRCAYLDAAPLSDGAYVAADAEFDFSEVYPDQPVLRGLEAMRRFRDSGPWGRSIHFEPERYFDVDDERVLVFVRVSSTGQASGAGVESAIAQEFTVRDD